MSPLLFKIALSLILLVEWSEAALSDEQKRIVEGFYGRGELTGAMSFAQVRAHFHDNPHHLFNYANGNQQQEVHSYLQQLAAAPNPDGVRLQIARLKKQRRSSEDLKR